MNLAIVSPDTAMIVPGDGPPAPPSARHRWFIVQFRSQQERILFRYLGWLGIELYQFTHIKREERRAATRVATFPGYLFVRFDPEGTAWPAIHQIPGVIRILSSGDTPLPLPEGMLETMIEFHSAKPIRAPAEFDPIRLGEQVRIVDGPFTGYSGSVTMTGEEVIGVFITIFKRSSTVKLQRKSVSRELTPPIGKTI